MNDLIPVRMEVPDIPPPKGNLDEIQQNVDSLLASYTGRVYTGEETVDAKKDRAKLNAWEKQLAAAAKALKDHYMAALDGALGRIAAMRSQIRTCAGAIDDQVKAVEEAERAEKRAALEGIYRDAAGDDLAPLVPFDRVLEPRWLNKTVSLATAGRELRKALETHREALRLIRQSCGADAEACTTEYLRGLSLNDALREHQRREASRAAQAQAEAARQAAQRAQRAAPVVIPPTDEEREIQAEAAQAARANACITRDGRLDTELLQQFAEPAPRQPERRRYRFWVEFTADDIAWFRAGAAERGFRFGSIKNT